MTPKRGKRTPVHPAITALAQLVSGIAAEWSIRLQMHGRTDIRNAAWLDAQNAFDLRGWATVEECEDAILKAATEVLPNAR